MKTKVTNKLLLDNTVTNNNIIDGSIETRHFSNLSVTPNKLSPVDIMKTLGTPLYPDYLSIPKTVISTSTSSFNGVATIVSNLPVIIYGNMAAYGYTSESGVYYSDYNFFDVFPPEGRTMSQFIDGIVTIRRLIFAGSVDSNDGMRCFYGFHNGNSRLPTYKTDNKYNADRIRVYVQNTEQRSAPSANFIFFWR